MKINTKKIEEFNRLIDALLEEGYDLSIEDGHTNVRIYLMETCFSLVLGLDGKWRLD